MIVMNHINKEYKGGTYALHDITLSIADGEFVFITGESGAGKSTFIKLLTKEISPTSGTISVDGRDVTRMKKRKVPLFRRKIGCIFQDFRLLDDLSIYENVAFAERVVGTPSKVIQRKVPQMLSMVGLSSKAEAMPAQLSGGERQRVAIARAVINRPKILLADEPTGNLDEYNSWEIMKLLDDVNKSGTTVIVVSHNMEIVSQMNRRTISLKYGVIQETADRKKGETDVF